MNLPDADERLVTELLQARDKTRLAPTPSNVGIDLTLDRAYQIGRALHDRLVSQGLVPVGRKIGVTNRAMWEQFRVSEPVWAHAYAQTVHFAPAGHARVSIDSMVAPRLEPEIVLRLRSAVPSGEPSAEQLASCLEWAAAGFEVVD